MLEFGGLWQQQNNPACTKSVRVFIMLKLDTIIMEEEEEEHHQLAYMHAVIDSTHTDRQTDR